jgi:histidyl-tRNA synthetase
MAEYIRPRGTRDFGPEEMKARRTIEGYMRKAIESYGYEEIATPTFEHSDLFVARSGPQILEQIYNFKDKGGRDIVLRPELTAPVMRFYSSDLRNSPKPLRIYYFGNCFRYERPQKGRYREFWQLGLEYIGKRTPLALSEVINSAISSLESVGLEGFQVRIGHVALLTSILSEWGIQKDDKDLMIAIDKKDEKKIRKRLGRSEKADRVSRLISSLYKLEEADKALEELIGIIPSIDETAVKELERVLEMIVINNGEVIMDPSITRGLDYYDGVVFEIDAPSLGAEKQICGGGAYSLSEILGNEVEGIGFGLGFDRIVLAVGDNIDFKSETPLFYLIPIGENAQAGAPNIAAEVRSKGAKCTIETTGKNFKKALNSALAAGATYLIIIGDDEIEKNIISLKNLAKEDQQEIGLNELGEFIESLL